MDIPDTTTRPHRFEIALELASPPEALYGAWIDRFDEWFAFPGTLNGWAQEGGPYTFETRFDGQRHPHYGRFLQLVENRLVELTWVTGNPGTHGAETILNVTFEPLGNGTRLTLVHAGFYDQETCDGHGEHWPVIMSDLDQRLLGDRNE